jgi:hypothetical protein
MAVRGEEQRVLVSIVGEDIERNLNSALNYASVEADMDQKKHNSHCPNWRSSGYVFGNAWLKPKEEPRGLYRILGIYSDSEAASKIFPQIAIEYAANAAQHEIERLVETIEDEIKSISNRFKVK